MGYGVGTGLHVLPPLPSLPPCPPLRRSKSLCSEVSMSFLHEKFEFFFNRWEVLASRRGMCLLSSAVELLYCEAWKTTCQFFSNIDGLHRNGSCWLIESCVDSRDTRTQWHSVRDGCFHFYLYGAPRNFGCSALHVRSAQWLCPHLTEKRKVVTQALHSE